MSETYLEGKVWSPLLKGEANFNYLPWRGDFEKFKEGGGSMVQGQVFLKGGLAFLLCNFFKVYHFHI